MDDGVGEVDAAVGVVVDAVDGDFLEVDEFVLGCFNIHADGSESGSQFVAAFRQACRVFLDGFAPCDQEVVVDIGEEFRARYALEGEEGFSGIDGGEDGRDRGALGGAKVGFVGRW